MFSLIHEQIQQADFTVTDTFLLQIAEKNLQWNIKRSERQGAAPHRSVSAARSGRSRQRHRPPVRPLLLRIKRTYRSETPESPGKTASLWRPTVYFWAEWNLYEDPAVDLEGPGLWWAAVRSVPLLWRWITVRSVAEASHFPNKSREKKS